MSELAQRFAQDLHGCCRCDGRGNERGRRARWCPRQDAYMRRRFGAVVTLRELAHNPCYAKARRGLLVTDIIDVPATAYRGLLDYEHEAAELGYPALA